jgi:hypothetical protein
MAKLKRYIVLVAVSLSLGVGAGSLVRIARESATLRASTEPSQSAASRRHGDLSRARGAVDVDLAAQVAEVRARVTGQRLRRELVDLLAKSALEHAALAVQNAVALTDEEGQIEALHESLPHWLAQDREAAGAWLFAQVATLPPSVALSLLRDTAAFDPALALSLAQRLAPGSRVAALCEIFNSWAETAPERAAQGAAQLPEGDGQVRVVGGVARVWAEQAPAEAEAWASALTTREARREALIPIVDSWATQDPKQAAAALAKLPDEGYKQRLVDTVAAEWVRESPLDARAWVETLAPALRDGAATALLGSLLQSDAQRAADWSLELGGDEQSPVVETTLTSWAARDPGALLAWVIKLPERRGRNELLLLVNDRFRLQTGPSTR